MEVYFPLLIATLMLGLIASPASAQCENCTCGQTCKNMCGNVCLDGMVCANCPENPIECVGGTEPYCPTTPIIIDGKNQGFHLTSMKSGVKFTFGASLVQTSWTDADSSNAWLALDRTATVQSTTRGSYLVSSRRSPRARIPTATRRWLCSMTRGTVAMATARLTPATQSGPTRS